MDAGYSILIAAILATWGWVFTNRTSQQNSRRQHTFKFYYEYKFEEENEDNVVEVMILIKNNNIPHPFDYLKAKEYRKIDKLLDQYEYLSSAVYNGDMDENFVRSVDGSMYIYLVDKLGEYINQTRDNQKTAFKNLTNLVERWGSSNQLTWLQKVYEWWKMKPYVKLPLHIRLFNDFIIDFNLYVLEA